MSNFMSINSNDFSLGINYTETFNTVKSSLSPKITPNLSDYKTKFKEVFIKDNKHIGRFNSKLGITSSCGVNCHKSICNQVGGKWSNINNDLSCFLTVKTQKILSPKFIPKKSLSPKIFKKNIYINGI